MSEKSFNRNAGMMLRYEKGLRDRVRLLKLQCEELEYSLHFVDLQEKHREVFPEMYENVREPVVQQESVEEVNTETKEDGITEGKDKSE